MYECGFCPLYERTKKTENENFIVVESTALHVLYLCRFDIWTVLLLLGVLLKVLLTFIISFRFMCDVLKYFLRFFYFFLIIVFVHRINRRYMHSSRTNLAALLSTLIMCSFFSVANFIALPNFSFVELEAYILLVTVAWCFVVFAWCLARRRKKGKNGDFSVLGREKSSHAANE